MRGQYTVKFGDSLGAETNLDSSACCGYKAAYQ